jgi:hypothetical protein
VTHHLSFHRIGLRPGGEFATSPYPLLVFPLGTLLIEGFILCLAYYLSKMFIKGASLHFVGAILGLVFIVCALRTLRFITI